MAINTFKPSPETFKLIDNFIPGYFLVIDLNELSVSYLSCRGLKLINRSLEDIIGTTVYDIRQYIEPCFSENFFDLLKRAITNKEEEAIFWFKILKKSAWFYAILKLDYNNNLIYCFIHPVSAIEGNNSVLLHHFFECNYKGMADTANEKKLTRREKQILKLVADGQTSKAIAENLYISKHTVDNHRKKILKKLGIKSLYELRNIMVQ